MILFVQLDKVAILSRKGALISTFFCCKDYFEKILTAFLGVRKKAADPRAANYNHKL